MDESEPLPTVQDGAEISRFRVQDRLHWRTGVELYRATSDGQNVRLR